KEWRRLARASSTPWLLAAYVLAPAAVAALYLQTSNRGPAGLMPQMVPLMGAQALSNVAAWQILLLAVWAPWLASSLLASEVEERTLEPFLAGGGRLLGAVAGKWLAVVMFFALVLAAGLPAFALPMLVGGVNWGLIGRVLAIEGATVLAMAGVGLALSALGRRAGNLAMAGVALGLALTLGTALAANAAGMAGQSFDPRMLSSKRVVVVAHGDEPKWLYANPLAGLTSALDNGSMALVPIPRNWTEPFYETYQLWQVQSAVGAGLGLVLAVLSWLVMAVRLKWRRPLWALRRRKAVAVNG
ncbi:MAG TPA: ABC transporter permease subunit, partial [Symbiobacteriaceae bacterium]|nr:ABC transporter permease subunit [Symbiobacteriaceae bacterium]